jgi:hypothetical protein
MDDVQAADIAREARVEASELSGKLCRLEPTVLPSL